MPTKIEKNLLLRISLIKNEMIVFLRRLNFILLIMILTRFHTTKKVGIDSWRNGPNRLEKMGKNKNFFLVSGY